MSTSDSKSNPIIIGLIVLVAIAVAVFAMYFVDVDQTAETKLPEVDVQVTEGQLPEFEVKTGEVNVGTKTIEVEVEVPTVTIETAKD